MKMLSLVILTGFLSLSLFGFLGMIASSEMAHAPTTCLASLAQNGACPPEGNTLASAFFHASAFKVFSTTLLSVTIALLSLAFLFAGFVQKLLQQMQVGARAFTRYIDELLSQYLALRKLKLALARFEHSPTSR